MPILTTTYPLMNSTFNVSQHTLKLIQEKMLVAAEICDRILEGSQEQWETLFKVIHNPIEKLKIAKSYTKSKIKNFGKISQYLLHTSKIWTS